MLNDDVLKEKAATEEFGNNSLSGTAFTVSSENGAIALITCAHIVSFPDTVVAYREDPTAALHHTSRLSLYATKKQFMLQVSLKEVKLNCLQKMTRQI